jgi:thiol-disulfide isomerase/thioredoxin
MRYPETASLEESRAWQHIGAHAAMLLFIVLMVPLTNAEVRGMPPAPRIAAPKFEMVTFSGEAYDNSALKGHPTLLVFWAPWCNVCQRELPLLSDFSQHTKPPQLKIISIGFADTRANVETFVKSRGATFVFPTAYDDDRWIAQAFKVNATPTYVLLDEQGLIVLVHRGGGLLQNAQFQDFIAAINKS